MPIAMFAMIVAREIISTIYQSESKAFGAAPKGVHPSRPVGPMQYRVERYEQRTPRTAEFVQLGLQAIKLIAENLAAFAGGSNLRYVNFVDCEFAIDSLRSLTSTPSLLGLTFQSCRITGNSLEPLKTLSNLASISLKQCSLNDSDLRCLYGSTNAIELSVAEKNMTEGGVLDLREANPAWSVRFHGGPYANSSLGQNVNYIPSVLGMPETKKLAFSGSHITDATLDLLNGGTNVTEVILTACAVTDLGLVHLQSLKHLESLSIIEVKISDEGLRAVQGLENLRWVNLNATNVRGSGLKYLPKKIKTLNLMHTFTNDAAVHLARFEELGTLYLGGPLISDEALDDLAKLDSLRTLVLWDTAVSKAGLDRLKQALPNCVELFAEKERKAK